MTDPSSITSVTDEDELSDESDTTETSYHSKASDGVSSIMYSSECNTDDKLTPSLLKISISQNKNASTKTSPRKSEENNVNSKKNTHDDSDTTPTPFPYGCNPLPLNRNTQKIAQPRKKQKRSYQPLTKYVLQKRLGPQNKSYLPKQEEENFGIDDPDNYLYTDCSDTSSIPWQRNDNEEIDSDNDEDGQPELNGDHRPLVPDMSSPSWFQAQCFDRYWSHYSFVMEWYRQHVHAVSTLSSQFAWQASHPQASHPGLWPQPQTSQPSWPKKKNKSSTTKRAKKRARSRRLVKAKQRALAQEDDGVKTGTSTAQDSDSEENEYEMEITDEMMEFMTTSFKYRMERDIKKEGNDDSKAEDKDNGKDGISSQVNGLLGPIEQPGVRRTAEMKTLYGLEAPMIHGMETALQMTYDNIVDRHQPKLWPNMPLKIVFK